MPIQGPKARSEIFSNRPHDGSKPFQQNMSGMNDFVDPFLRQINPSPGALDPKGPANFPITDPAMPAPTDALINGMSTDDLLRTMVRLQRANLNTSRAILNELRAQNIAGIPNLRSADVDDTNGATLDYSAVGYMSRFLLRNKGPNSCWIAFDVDGKAVEAFTGSLSYELQAQESICIPNCRFYKIGAICASGSGESAVIHCVAFLPTAGNLNLDIA